ncbi:hypothetical protein AWC02_15360 [Mycolicibacter engbaekii]|uniref:Uncharacterized protein n=1 Tax=Mycolicibacter engbaekii TaxID=188915 RepID=A0A1X1TFQ5_9MYCO|nr:hypothetical protein AWC02_15360 [Mycolicibacter engbaekii]
MMRFSEPHALFAADLLTECASTFLQMTRGLDVGLELAASSAASERRAATALHARRDRDTLVAAAAYIAWIGDHIRQQTARVRIADVEAAARYCDPGTDEMALRQREIAEARATADSFASLHLAPTPPPRPGELQGELHPGILAQLERAREWCEQAIWAASQSNTTAMEAVGSRLRVLLFWVSGQCSAP